MYSVLYNC